MLATLTIIRYKRRFIPFAVLAMAIHHIPLFFNKTISFYKLMGCGKNGTFDKNPEWRQWAILAVYVPGKTIKDVSPIELYGNFISRWISFFRCQTGTFLLEPVAGHGSWDGKECFGKINSKQSTDGIVAVLTRATIRFSGLRAFWHNVPAVAHEMNAVPGFITSVGIGEVPYIKQATFSVWENMESMKAFAYQMKTHAEVIRKTRKENWYSEEMFVRFKLLKTSGFIAEKVPLNGIL